MKTVGTYVTREEAEAVRAEMMKRPATPYQDSVSLLHIKNHVGTRKSRLPSQVNGLTFGGAFSTALEPNTSSRVTVLESSVKLKLSTTRSSKT